MPTLFPSEGRSLVVFQARREMECGVLWGTNHHLWTIYTAHITGSQPSMGIHTTRDAKCRFPCAHTERF